MSPRPNHSRFFRARASAWNSRHRDIGREDQRCGPMCATAASVKNDIIDTDFQCGIYPFDIWAEICSRSEPPRNGGTSSALSGIVRVSSFPESALGEIAGSPSLRPQLRNLALTLSPEDARQFRFPRPCLTLEVEGLKP